MLVKDLLGKEIMDKNGDLLTITELSVDAGLKEKELSDVAEQVSFRLTNGIKRYIVIPGEDKVAAINFTDENINSYFQELNEKITAEKIAKTQNEVNILKGRAKAYDEMERNARHRGPEENAAFKATFCISDDNQFFVSPCCEKVRDVNCSRNGGEWCRSKSLCQKYIHHEITLDELMNAWRNGFLCYESVIFRDWKVGAGYNVTDGKARNWTQLQKDSLMMITTVPQGKEEKDRIIVGAFLVRNVFPKDDENNKEAWCDSYENCRIQLTPKEAESMKYWEYSSGDGKDNLIQWKEGLFRYQSDSVCATVLKDLVRIVEKRGNGEETKKAKEFLQLYLQRTHIHANKISAKKGALK